jgi:hypothetical protein
MHHCLIHVGIVYLEGGLPCRPSNKPHHHGGVVHHYSCIVVANQQALSTGASLEGVGQGRSARVLFCLTMRLREKNISIHNRFISLFYIPLDSFVTKTIELHLPPTARTTLTSTAHVAEW